MAPSVGKIRTFLVALIFAFIVLVIFTGGFFHRQVLADDELLLAYASAIEDARTAGEAEVCSNLMAVAESNTNLIWSGEAGSRRVLAVTWTSWDGYLNKTMLNASQEVWVTMAPQLKEFIAGNNIPEEGCVLRLEQLLGLPPHAGKKWFVEFWVKPEDLFRPASDSEVGDMEAGFYFPENASLEYRAWFNSLRDSSYGSGGYPWTRLGYTYDWGNLGSDVGLSEFVVRKGAQLEVKGVWENREYCRA